MSGRVCCSETAANTTVTIVTVHLTTCHTPLQINNPSPSGSDLYTYTCIYCNPFWNLYVVFLPSYWRCISEYVSLIHDRNDRKVSEEHIQRGISKFCNLYFFCHLEDLPTLVSKEFNKIHGWHSRSSSFTLPPGFLMGDAGGP